MSDVPVQNRLVIDIHPEHPGHFLIEAVQWIPRSREEVYEFFSDPFNLEQITPAWLHFHVTTPRPIVMRAGLLLEYRLRLHGFPLRWRSEIPVWEPPCRFVDQQLRGPYRKWYHEHLFEELRGGTLVTDRVTYASRGGGLIHRLFVKPDLLRIFEFRQKVLANIFQ